MYLEALREEEEMKQQQEATEDPILQMKPISVN